MLIERISISRYYGDQCSCSTSSEVTTAVVPVEGGYNRTLKIKHYSNGF